MRRAALAIAFALLESCLSLAQVSIQSRESERVPQYKVDLMTRVAFRVVAEEFHERRVSEIEFPLVLVLGEDNERYAEDEKAGVYTIYLKRWDEQKFAVAAMRLALQRLLPREREGRMLREILRRSDRIAPIDANAVRNHEVRTAERPPAGISAECVSATRQSLCRSLRPPQR